MEKVLRIEKNSVQETLMLPLYGKVHCMKNWPDEFHDTDCIRIKEMIDYDFSELEQKFKGLYGKIASLSAGFRQFALAEEKSARKDNIAWAVKHFPQTKPVELQGLAHAELVMIHPDRFRSEAMRFLAD